MTDVLALDEIDDVFDDIGGVVTDTFERAHAPDDVQHEPARARIFHHECDALAQPGLVFELALLILMAELHRRRTILASERLARHVHHPRPLSQTTPPYAQL